MPSYRLIGAASGRMACSTPNLQNIPRDPAYRRCIRPAAGRVLVKADYSQIELRIAAQVSGDTAMQEAFRAGEDLHTTTARAVLGREPTKDDRQLAKALNFGLLYGMGAERLRIYAQDEYGVTLSEAEAARFRQRFFQTYPGLASLASRSARGCDHYLHPGGTAAAWRQRVHGKTELAGAGDRRRHPQRGAGPAMGGPGICPLCGTGARRP